MESKVNLLIVPCLNVPCLIVPCLIVPCLIVPCLIVPCLIVPCLIVPFLIVPCLIVPCLIVPCLIVPCLNVPIRVKHSVSKYFFLTYHCTLRHPVVIMQLKVATDVQQTHSYILPRRKFVRASGYTCNNRTGKNELSLRNAGRNLNSCIIQRHELTFRCILATWSHYFQKS